MNIERLIITGAIGLLLLSAAWLCRVHAEPVIPDEATKRCALLKAYQMNGNSMVGWGSIDMSKDTSPCPKTIRVIPITPKEQPKGTLK